jgi:hypothetical protein
MSTSEFKAGQHIVGVQISEDWPDIDEDLSVSGILAGLPAAGVRVPLHF